MEDSLWLVRLTVLRWMLVSEMELRSGNWLLTLTEWPHKCFWIIPYANITTSSHCAHFYTMKFNPYCFPLYQVQCQAQTDALFLCLRKFSLSSYYLMAAFELWIFWKTNLDQTVGIHKNILGCKVLNLSFQHELGYPSDLLSLTFSGHISIHV
jgi:hypothetical protein